MKFRYTLIVVLTVLFLSLTNILASCTPDPVPGEDTSENVDPNPTPDPDPEPIPDPDPDPTPDPDPDPTPDPEPSDGIIRILAIGNSFSQDAVEQYLYDLFKADGQEVIIGNLYIGGCTLETHYKLTQSGEGKYAYRKVVGGVKTEQQNVTIANGIMDEKWDYISLQQASGSSGKYDTYTSFLPGLISYVKANCSNPNLTLMWHQTWAYASTSDHAEFPKYDSDQMTMYNAIMDAGQSALRDNPDLKMVIPSGTAIQNGRTSYIGDAFNRDGYHLEVNFGRYTAACTWYEAISGKSVVGNAYAPAGVSAAYKEICQNAAHAAVLKPWEVTTLTDFLTPKVEDAAMSQPVWIDFGGASTSPSAEWNKVTVYKTDKPIYLNNAEGKLSAVQISALTGFTGTHNGVGSENQKELTIHGVVYPCAVWCDGILISGTKEKGNVGPAILELSGIPSGLYKVQVIAVRYNGSLTARQTQYVLKGEATSEMKSINQGLKTYATTNEGNEYDDYEVVFDDVAPSADGKLMLEVTAVDTGAACDGQVSAILITKK